MKVIARSAHSASHRHRDVGFSCARGSAEYCAGGSAYDFAKQWLGPRQIAREPPVAIDDSGLFCLPICLLPLGRFGLLFVVTLLPEEPNQPFDAAGIPRKTAEAVGEKGSRFDDLL